MTRQERKDQEATRRRELLDWFATEARTPLAEQRLSTPERREIQQRVLRGRLAQNWWHGVIR